MGQDRSEIRLTFAEIERIVGFTLPPATYKHGAVWYPSDTHVMATVVARNGWRATPHLRGQAVTFRRQWDEGPLLSAVSRLMNEADSALFRRVYAWAKENGAVKAGTGRIPGFTYQPAGLQHAVFTVNGAGVVTVRLGWLCRSLPVERVEAFRAKLGALPGAKGMDEPVKPEEDQHPELPLAALQGAQWWEVFVGAVANL